ncbi:MAG: glycosyltransferase family 2 protein [Candidatus Levybacteria bacterium]|nr:glycosyltransferase family 2 protein [Candidatus Levybacteria bacterium]
MYKNKRISLVFPVFNEEKNIGRAIEDFKRLCIIDEIVVIDNNSSDRSAKIASAKRVKVIKEKKQGYGFALRRGMREAKGDLIVLCEPDGTFVAKDLLRLLDQSEIYDMVMGTRTNARFIGKRANMGRLLRLGNITLAKIIQYLYSSNSPLSDCGCTFRVMKKSLVKKIMPKLKVGGSYFLAELLVVSLFSGLTIKEIPVHYRERVGESKITGSLEKSVIVGLQMFNLALKYRLKRT